MGLRGDEKEDDDYTRRAEEREVKTITPAAEEKPGGASEDMSASIAQPKQELATPLPVRRPTPLQEAASAKVDDTELVYKLVYFDTRGAAEPIRLLLVVKRDQPG